MKYIEKTMGLSFSIKRTPNFTQKQMEVSMIKIIETKFSLKLTLVDFIIAKVMKVIVILTKLRRSIFS